MSNVKLGFGLTVFAAVAAGGYFTATSAQNKPAADDSAKKPAATMLAQAPAASAPAAQPNPDRTCTRAGRWTRSASGTP